GLNVFIKHSSSKGDIDFQDYKSSAVDLAGYVKTGNNLQWNGRIGGKIDEYNKYGAAFKIPGETADSMEMVYQNWRGR
ncbi:hypothetical protein, partial [Salmonella sp. SAL4431]|uniref:hypothetical protein n=1 Tax=Salmonella sp. SAL4431 TaxID=3159886 RepID=UPI00397D4ECC